MMKKANLPKETAREPDEDAHEPQIENKMSPPNVTSDQNRRKCNITFSEDTQSTDTFASQNNRVYKDALSQPALGLSHRQRLQWLQKRRERGLWVQCDDCSRWRYLPHVLDAHELPDKWYCNMNPDTTASDCSVPEAPLQVRLEEDLIHGEYSAGSVVWARLPGWPWWPAMVDDCPDTEQYYWLDGFSDIPTHYNVVFFDTIEVSRAWIAPVNLKPYAANKHAIFKQLTKVKKYKKRLEVAMTQADDAESLPLPTRFATYSFIAKYPGAINEPPKITKKYLKKFQNQLKRKYNIAFSNENESESDEEAVTSTEVEIKRNNVIILGTPKGQKAKKSRMDANLNNDTSKKSENLLDSLQMANDNSEKVADNQFVNPESGSEVFKQPNSVSAQAGSVEPFALREGSFDNDTSKTYVPESQSESESFSIQETVRKIQVRVASPRSDDFEF